MKSSSLSVFVFVPENILFVELRIVFVDWVRICCAVVDVDGLLCLCVGVVVSLFCFVHSFAFMIL